MKRRSAFFLSLITSAMTVLSGQAPLQAAERIFFVYTPLNFSLRVDSLERFAKKGVVNNELRFYFNALGVTAEEIGEIQALLTKPADFVDPMNVARFCRTPTGEMLLAELGKFLAIPWDINGKYALRSAIITASLDPEGLTALNLIKRFPTDIHVNLENLLRAAELLNILGEATNALGEEMEQLSLAQTAQEPAVDYASLPNLDQPGPAGVKPQQVWQLEDKERDRRFRLLVYQPQSWIFDKTPVIVVSHGLASNPESFTRWAEHLASYGYFVVLPQHPGSDSEKLEAMLSGLGREIFSTHALIDRPLDVSFVLDELERRNSTQFQGRLDTHNVGVWGHSFGGYTAMMVAGARINFSSLDRDCNRQVPPPNLAQVIHCRALELPRDMDYNFRDERVQAIAVLNPVTGAIFGAEGLDSVTIPVLMAGGSQDPATPVAIEQLRAFVWLGSQTKYFGYLVGQAHVNFDQLDGSVNVMLDSLGSIQRPNQQTFDKYGDHYYLAFAKVYLSQDKTFKLYLQAGFSQFISQPDNPLFVVNGDAAPALASFFNQRKPARTPPISPFISLTD